MGIIINTVLIFLALLGLYLFIRGIVRLRRRQRIRGGVQSTTGMLVLASAVLLLAVSSHMYTYRRLTHEQDVAEVTFQAKGPQLFEAKMDTPDGKQQQWLVRGDEWQIGARILKWHSLANLFGMDAVYRLDRLSGHYRDINRERNETHTVYQLSENPGLDVWRMAQQNRWLPWLDAIYGSAAYMPLADQGRFKVTLSQTGMVIRPMNNQASEAVSKWR